MNIKQMKSAIAKFRKADVSVIKDEKLRAKAQKLQNKEKGFTLLELLVVITLIAILATGALIAYEDVGDSAEAASAGNAAATIDRAIRTYRAVENVYPNQWDNLMDGGGSALQFAPTVMGTYLAPWTTPTSANTAFNDILTAFVDSGIEEIQVVNSGAEPGPNDAPNRFHNESSGSAFEAELEEEQELPSAFAVLPTGACDTGSDTDIGNSLPTTPYAAGSSALTDNSLQNSYGDALEDDECHLVVALGFGGDAAASTTFSNVAIAQSPTYIRNTGNEDTAVNPETDYSRYVGLFQVGEYADTDDDGAQDAWEWNDTIRLIAIVSTDGKNIDQLNSEAQQ